MSVWKWCYSTLCKTSAPGSSFEPGRRPVENKAELITLAIGNNNILQFFHDRACTPCHQPQGPVVIGLCKLVLLCKPETQRQNNNLDSNSSWCFSANEEYSLVKIATIQSHDNVAVPQTGVICFEVAHILKLTFGHVTGSGEKTDRRCKRTARNTKSARCTN